MPNREISRLEQSTQALNVSFTEDDGREVFTTRSPNVDHIADFLLDYGDGAALAGAGSPGLDAFIADVRAELQDNPRAAAYVADVKAAFSGFNRVRYQVQTNESGLRSWILTGVTADRHHVATGYAKPTDIANRT